jgi:hypothetical protein
MVLVGIGIYLLTLTWQAAQQCRRQRCTSLSTCTDEHRVCIATSCAAELCTGTERTGLDAARTIGTYACCANWTARKLDSPLRLIIVGHNPSAHAWCRGTTTQTLRTVCGAFYATGIAPACVYVVP